MKTIATLLSVLAIVGAASVASANPVAYEDDMTFWEERSLYGPG